MPSILAKTELFYFSYSTRYQQKVHGKHINIQKRNNKIKSDFVVVQEGGLGETSTCFAFQLVFNLELYKERILLSAVFNEINPPLHPGKHSKYFKYSTRRWEIKHSMYVFTPVLVRVPFRANRLKFYTSISLWQKYST